VRRIIDGVAEDSAFLRSQEDSAIHGSTTGGGDGEKNVAEIFGAEFTLMPNDILRCGKIGYFRFGLRRDNGEVSAGAEQGGDFRSGNRAGADDEARSIFEFDERRK
jgi:hypothetical protein